MKNKQIILRFLEAYPGTTIESHTLQKEVPEFAQRVYGVLVNPETISREWRLMRNNPKYLSDNGFLIIEALGHNGKEKKWQIRRINEIHRNSSREAQQPREDYSSGRTDQIS